MFEVDASKEFAEVHESSLTPCENMVKMTELSEAAILHNLRMRYTDSDIYVSCFLFNHVVKRFLSRDSTRMKLFNAPHFCQYSFLEISFCAHMLF